MTEGRGALFGQGPVDPFTYCHAPLIVRDATTLLGDVITRLKVWPDHTQDDIIDQDIILVWAAEKRNYYGGRHPGAAPARHCETTRKQGVT